MISNILIIDDDPVFRLLTKRIIYNISPDYNCLEAENGKIGMELLESMRDNTSKITILLDLNMPQMNGWEFLDLLNEDKFQNLKIFIVTSSIYENDKLKSKQYSLVKKFYSKPLSKQDLLEIL